MRTQLDKFIAERPGLEFELQRLRQNGPELTESEGAAIRVRVEQDALLLMQQVKSKYGSTPCS